MTGTVQGPEGFQPWEALTVGRRECSEKLSGGTRGATPRRISTFVFSCTGRRWRSGETPQEEENRRLESSWRISEIATQLVGQMHREFAT
jgi:hypothetical protein